MFPKRILKYITIVVLGIITPALIWFSAQAQNTTKISEMAQGIPERNAYYGDLHVHTGWSFDSYAQLVRTNPDDAYKFAQGQVISHASGYNIQLQQPLDFYAVTDHAEYLGVMPELANPDSPILETEIGQELSEQFASGDPDQATAAYFTLLNSINTSTAISDLTKPEVVSSIFEKIVETADKYYQPGKFTTFPAYEWTSNPNDANLHRNVIFRSSENVPEIPFSAFDSDKPEDLWKHLDGLREQGMTDSISYSPQWQPE